MGPLPAEKQNRGRDRDGGHGAGVPAGEAQVSVSEPPDEGFEDHLGDIEVRVQPLADELRAVMVDRLDLCIEKLHAQIQDPEAAGRLARNVEILVQVEERRAKLLGVDAPERIEATVTRSPRRMSPSLS